MSQKFQVSVERTYIHKGTIEVDANSIEEARVLALALIGDAEMSIHQMIDNEDTVDGFSIGEAHQAVEVL